ncbi:hypothetical protein LTR08_003671 [Meristemomyces frigidus]|nr:hypothetical protein LTR08_003671 [Meristemomyces frigidus]
MCHGLLCPDVGSWHNSADPMDITPFDAKRWIFNNSKREVEMSYATTHDYKCLLLAHRLHEDSKRRLRVLTAKELKEIMDVTSFGAYDFSYLRMDFMKTTNNKRLVEMSYATVQGYDCLMKIRNSAIMSEYVEYRPKLWYTYDTAPEEDVIGTEMAFPAPNNLSKKQRSHDNAALARQRRLLKQHSHDNAGSIGLYAPRSAEAARSELTIRPRYIGGNAAGEGAAREAEA